MPGRLRDKVALVTGAGCIGPGWGNDRATAVLFAREGAKVFAVDKNGESMKETLDRVKERLRALPAVGGPNRERALRPVVDHRR